MYRRKKSPLIVIACLLVFSMGCGDSSSTSSSPSPAPTPAAPQGKVVQNYVNGATVWADRIVQDGIGDAILEAEEEATATFSDMLGQFQLKATPAYDYVLVSTGGRDSLLGTTALPMLAPKEATHITPLTTLVTLEPSLKILLGGKGFYDADIASPDGTDPDLLKIAKIAELLAATHSSTQDQLKIMKSLASALKQAANLPTAADENFLLNILTSLAPATKTRAEAYIKAIGEKTMAGKVIESRVVKGMETFRADLSAFHMDQEKILPGGLLTLKQGAFSQLQKIGLELTLNAGTADTAWPHTTLVIEAKKTERNAAFQTKISFLDIQAAKDGKALVIQAPQPFTLFTHSMIVSADGQSSWGGDATTVFPVNELARVLNITETTIFLEASKILSSSFFTPGEYILRFSIWNAPGLMASEQIRILVQE